MHFADRLRIACQHHGAAVCVGLDPVFERLPGELRRQAKRGLRKDDPPRRIEAIEVFCTGVLDAVAEHVPCVKIQAACFERYRGPGFDAMFRVIAAARQRGLMVILDAKRGDIGTTAAHYASGLLEGATSADALTVNAYLGPDSLQPFIDVAQRHGKGLFALVRTSNPGGDALQGLLLKNERTVAQMAADMIARLGSAEPQYLGESGESLLGAVVAATRPADAVALRDAMPRQVFLVPGFGAQGGGIADVKPCFRGDGTGAIVTASRSVIYAFDQPSYAGETDWRDAVAKAARHMNEQLAGLFA